MGSHSAPINLSPTPVPGRLAALPSKQTGTMQLFVKAGDLQQRQMIALPYHPPPFLPCSEMSQIKRETKPQITFATFPPQLHYLENQTFLTPMILKHV